MAGPMRQLTRHAARDRIAERCLVPAAAPAEATSSAPRVGLECEWHVRPLDHPAGTVPVERLRTWLDPLQPLPGGSAVSYEPGGQLELSSPPRPGAAAAIASAALDRAAVEQVLAAQGVELVATGVDPQRPPLRQLRAPRYEAMEAFFDGDGPHGRVMMTRTASVQVNVDSGVDAADAELRWRRAHQVGPVLAAAFANSPMAQGRRTGWRSTRLANWFAMDPSRTAPAYGPGGGLSGWVDYALDARVMLIRVGDTHFQPVRDGLTFDRWLDDGHELGWPDADDLDYHLTTLFPPVRPRGWFELRFLDALPDPWWRVAAVAAVSALDDEACADAVERATAGTAHLWCEAASLALHHPELARAARTCFAGVLEAADRAGLDPASRQACADFYDRYVGPGRCPADDWT